MPAENRVCRGDGRHLRQRGTSHLVSEHSQTSPFLITELQASPAQVRPQHSILFPQERDHAVLLTHDPTAQSRDEQLERRHCAILRQPTFNPVLGQYGAALVVLLRTLGLLCSGHRAIALENVALRQQLSIFRRTVKRPHLRTSDRVFCVLLAKAWQDWRTALIVVQPDTVVRWHRQWLRRRWTQRSTRTRPGRPSTTAAIRTLVDQMTEANPLWGAPRIHGELGKLGIAVSERTVSRLLGRRRRPPSQTWRTFLTNHVASLVSADFFTVPTLTGRVLFVSCYSPTTAAESFT